MEKKQFYNVASGEMFAFNGSVFVATLDFNEDKKAYGAICVSHDFYAPYDLGTVYYFENLLEVEVIATQKIKELLDN